MGSVSPFDNYLSCSFPPCAFFFVLPGPGMQYWLVLHAMLVSSSHATSTVSSPAIPFSGSWTARPLFPKALPLTSIFLPLFVFLRVYFYQWSLRG